MLEAYRANLRLHVRPSLGTRSISKVTANDVASLISSMEREGLKPWTVKTTLVGLGLLFKHALRRNYVSDNPMARLEADEKPTITKREIRVLTHEEITALLNAAPKRHRTAIATALYSGLRVSELLGVRWQDVDFAAGLIHVRHQLSVPLARGRPSSSHPRPRQGNETSPTASARRAPQGALPGVQLQGRSGVDLPHPDRDAPAPAQLRGKGSRQGSQGRRDYPPSSRLTRHLRLTPDR